MKTVDIYDLFVIDFLGSEDIFKKSREKMKLKYRI